MIELLKIIPEFITLLAFVFSLYKYMMMKKSEALENELNNLRALFDIFETTESMYKEMFIRYPSGLAIEYRLNWFAIKKVDKLFYLNPKLSVYDNFYAYILSLLKYIPETELSLSQMISLYNLFVSNLIKRDKLDQTFQILYSCVHGIVSPKFIFKREKLKKIERIQNSITTRQAILYFFNQIQYSNRQRFFNEYANELKEHLFFKKMFESIEYNRIECIIPLDAEKMFYKLK